MRESYKILKSTSFICFILFSLVSNAQLLKLPSTATGFTNSLIDAKNSRIHAADFNGDAQIDVLVGGDDTFGNPAFRLYTNSGTNLNAVLGLPFYSDLPTSLNVADFNGDNKPDLLYLTITFDFNTFTNVNEIKLYTNSGTDFSLITTPIDAEITKSLFVADINNDNKPDIFAASSAGILLYTNTGSSFSLAQTIGSIDFGNMAVFDFNNDSKIDIIAYGQDASSNLFTKVFTFSGTTFSEAPSPFLGLQNASVTIADVNSDTRPDVFVTGRTQTNFRISKLYINNGNSNYAEHTATTFLGVDFGFITISDFNRDNQPDILLSGISSSPLPTIYDARLYINKGSNFELDPNTTLPGMAYGSSIEADLDADDEKELLVTGSTTNGFPSTRLYFRPDLVTQIIAQPQSQAVCVPNNANLSVSANGTNLTYLWSNGATTSSINTTLAGAYDVTVSGASGIVVSNSATVTIGSNTEIVSQPTAQVLVGADPVTLSVSATGSNLSYFWSNGSTSPSILTTIVGNYTVTVTGTCGTVISSNAPVIIETPKLCYYPVATFGSEGSSANQLYEPISVDVTSDGKIYIVDGGKYQINVWTQSGNTFGNLTAFDTEAIPMGVKVASDGKIYVIRKMNHEISVWTQSGNTFGKLTTFGSFGSAANQLFFAYSVDVASDGKIFVADPINSRISVWTQTGNTFGNLTTFGTKGSAANQFNNPVSAKVTTDGKIYVADLGNLRISVWTQSGNTFGNLTTFNQYGVSVDVASDGKIYVLNNNQISVWTQSGNTFGHLMNFGSTGNNKDQFRLPYSVKVASDSNIYIADTDNNRISLWKPTFNATICAGNLTDLTEWQQFASNLVLYPNPASNGEVSITYSGLESTLEIFNAQGTMVYSQPVSTNTCVIHKILLSGIYIVKVGTVSKKLVVN